MARRPSKRLSPYLIRNAIAVKPPYYYYATNMSEQIVTEWGPERYAAAAVFRERIEQRQGDLNIAAITLDGMDLYNFAAEIIDELELLCPYLGEPVCLSGLALMPDMNTVEDRDEFRGNMSPVAVLQNNDDDTTYGRVEGVSGVYESLVVHEFDGEFGKEYRIRQKVVLGYMNRIVGRGTRETRDILRGYFEYDTTIQPTDEIESSLRHGISDQELSSEEIAKIIDEYSDELVRMLHSRAFRRMPLRQQQDNIRVLIKMAEEASQVQDKYVSIGFTEPTIDDVVRVQRKDGRVGTTRRIYIPYGGRDGLHVIRKRQIPVAIGGVCVGLDSVEWSRLNQGPFRKTRDLYDGKAGLCLAIDPDRPTIDAVEIGEDQLIYVPVSGHRFDAQFS